MKEFLVGRFGGPQRYIEQRGHPEAADAAHALQADQRARDRWVQLMEGALEEAQLPKESKDLLCAFFHHMATFLMNTPA